MAKLVDVCQGEKPANLPPRQMPLIIDENLTMIMDVNDLEILCDSPLIQGKQLGEFRGKFDILEKEELKTSFEVTCKDMLAVLNQAVPCVGCRRSVERLFYNLVNSGHPALDPLVITAEGLLTIKEEILRSPQLLCTILQGHSARLSSLADRQPRSKKSRRCALHSLEVQRMRRPSNEWKEIWDRMKTSCRQQVTLLESDTLDANLEAYLRKHRFCGECRTKVVLASTLLKELESTREREKGYVPALYAGIKCCRRDRHIHLPTSTEYISKIIERAQPELSGERHAKTLEIAQEEVLTCLGICIAGRLQRVHRRLREEETICKVLADVAVDALSRNFQMAVEMKRGISQLELLYEEFTREEIVKQQRREKLRLKRKKKKERRYEAEEKENACECARQSNGINPLCTCSELKSSESLNSYKLQVLDPKNKGPVTCACSDCSKKPKCAKDYDAESKKNAKAATAVDKDKRTLKEPYRSCDGCAKSDERWYRDCNCNVGKANSKPPIELSQDCGYCSEQNASISSLSSTPDGSDCCYEDSPSIRSANSIGVAVPSNKGTLTLAQMLENSCLSDDEGIQNYIPEKDVEEFKSRMSQINEKRQELRQTLKRRFEMLCSRQKS